MFEALKRAFHSHSRHSGDGESRHLLNSPDRIAAILHQTRSLHTLLSASPGEDAGFFSTALLGVFPQQKIIVLDELNPRQGHEAFIERGRLRLEGRLNGVELSFETRLIKIGENRGVAFYHCSLPESLHYLQRRQDFRISTGTMNLPFHGSRGLLMSEVLRGCLYDISRNGVGVLLEGAQNLKPGDPLPNCSIRLPDSGEIHFALEVRYSARSHQRSITRLGGRYAEMDLQTRRRINRLIIQLERNQARRLRQR